MIDSVPGRIRELDGWRGVSILLVLLQHLAVYTFPAAAARHYWLYHVTGVAGDLGVRIFFAISGFVIARLLLIEEAKYGSISLKGFYTRRFFRILPVFYLFLAAVCLFSWLHWTPVTTTNILQSALFVKDLKSPTLDWFVGHSWSLAVEEQFYLVFPPILMVFSARKRPAVLLCGLAFFLAWSVGAQWGVFANLLNPSAITGFSCISVGVLLAIFEGKARALAARVPGWFVLAVGLFLLIRPLPHGRAAGSFYALLVPFGVGLLLMYTLSRPSWATAVLNSAALQWTGMVSYSAYLWQEIFTGRSDFYGSPTVARNFHLCLPLLVLTAFLSYRWIEKPCTRLGRRLSARPQAAHAISANKSVGESI